MLTPERQPEQLTCRVIPAAAGGAAFACAQKQYSQIVPMALGFAAFTALFDKVCPPLLSQVFANMLAPCAFSAMPRTL
jgi:hypothetical protein